jgi:serum/glucocorticoid-regulated kinase 2
LFQHLRKEKRFSEERYHIKKNIWIKRAKFYGAQIALGLGHLHSQNIIYRDMKPENVLMDENGYVCLTDFGMAKVLKQNMMANSFCGTPEYLGI